MARRHCHFLMTLSHCDGSRKRLPWLNGSLRRQQHYRQAPPEPTGNPLLHSNRDGNAQLSTARGKSKRKMPRNYRIERDAVIRRWYGGNPQRKNPRPSRSWNEGPITPADCLGIPMQVNSPFTPYGYCLVWKYGLNQYGYGTLTIDGDQELAHRAVFIQTRGRIPEDRQVNHLCNRPYCVQPSHLYAGTSQDNKDDSQIFNKEGLLHAPWILHRPATTTVDDPLLNRLLCTNRHDGTEPWGPAEQPAQKPLEEFTCPSHDFAITMFGGQSRICGYARPVSTRRGCSTNGEFTP